MGAQTLRRLKIAQAPWNASSGWLRRKPNQGIIRFRVLGNEILYRDYMAIVFPHSLLSTSKMNYVHV